MERDDQVPSTSGLGAGQEAADRVGNTSHPEIFFDPVLLHSIELLRFVEADHPNGFPPIPEEDTTKRPPNPNNIESSDLPRLSKDQCTAVTKTAITLLAQQVGYRELDEVVMDTLLSVLDNHLTDMMDFFAVCQQRRKEKLSCAFKTNVAQQVLSMFHIRYPGVLRDYYDNSVRASRDNLLKMAQNIVEGKDPEAEDEKPEEPTEIELSLEYTDEWADSEDDDNYSESDFD
uniref:BTP domain-containing protein n=1 Tax=Steinernema glaseri TaxID=37863 RepID=A0A1I7ZH68_9BILA